MARLHLLLVAALWLFALVRIAHARRRTRGDRRLVHALETLREWQQPEDYRAATR